MIVNRIIFEDSSGFKSVEYGDDVNGMWGADAFEMDDKDIKSLKRGKVLYTHNGEYAILIRRKQNKKG